MADKHDAPTVLIAEDDDPAARLLITNMRRAGMGCPVFRACNGKEAIKMLEDQHPEVQLTNQDRVVLLLDIRMPGMDGIEVLQYVKGSERLRRIPVIMLTTTDDPLEINRCYELGCNFYITKPVDYRKFVAMVNGLVSYLGVVTIPPFRKV